MKSFQAQTHYEVLEISVGASQAEVRSAHERLTRLYADDQAALYGLVDPAHAAALRKRLGAALEILEDEVLRELYDAEIGLPPRVSYEAPVRPSAPVLVRFPAPDPAPAPAEPPPPAASAPVAPASRAVASPAVAATGWGGAIAWVTASAPVAAPSAPSASTYSAVMPTWPVAAPAPVPEPPPEPSQLALDVTPAVASWGAKAQEREPAPLFPPPPQDLSPDPPRVDPVVATEPEKPGPPPEEPPVPMLSDDVQVSIVPARATPTRDFRVDPRPRASEIPEGVEINGDLLKQVRMAKGLSLVQLADRTRIGVKHLENVESDRYDALPAAVYLRGILMNLARELGLDGLRVSRSYLTFVEAHRSKG